MSGDVFVGIERVLRHQAGETNGIPANALPLIDTFEHNERAMKALEEKITALGAVPIATRLALHQQLEVLRESGRRLLEAIGKATD